MNEDFVSFDLAKKLKKKGYPQAEKNTLAMYNEDGEWYSLSPTLDDFYYDFRDFDENDCVSPTIAQVLKWLREEKKIHIVIDICNGDWEYSIKEKIRLDESLQYISQTTPVPICRGSLYEEAALAGIEYVIDNLI